MASTISADDSDSSTHHNSPSDTHSLKSPSELERTLQLPNDDDDLAPVPLTRLQFTLAFSSLCVVIFQYSTSVTMVSPSLPYIVMRFQRPDLMGWVGTAYMLTSTALAPVLGKVAGTVGGRAAMISSVALYSVGALVSATAPRMEVVIVGRAVSGMGGAGMFTIALIVVANIVPFRKRAMYQGYLSALLGVGLVIGPLLGGAFTDWFGWPAIFYFNAIFGAFTLLSLLFVRMDPPPNPSTPKTLHPLRKVDYPGLLLLILTLVALLTPLQMSTPSTWTSPQILAPLLLSILLAAAFIYTESRLTDPAIAIVPPAVFSTRTVIASESLSVCLGASLLSLTYFMPTFWQLVADRSAMLSGLDTLPVLAGMIITSLFSGYIITKFQIYTPFLRYGTPLLPLAFILLASTIHGPKPPSYAIYILELAAGVGLGSAYQTRVVTTQAAVPRPLIPSATSLLTMFQGLGGAIAIALFTSTFNAFLSTHIPQTASSLSPDISVPASVVDAIIASPRSLRATIAAAFADVDVQERVLEAFLGTFVDDFMRSFVVAVPFGVGLFVCGVLINVDLKRARETDKVEAGEVVELEGERGVEGGEVDLVVVKTEEKGEVGSPGGSDFHEAVGEEHPDTQVTIVGR